MKPFPFLIIISLILISISVSGDLKSDKLSPPQVQIKYEQVDSFSSDLFHAFRQLIGVDPKESQVVVYHGNDVLAVIPPDSKFNGMAITEGCLVHQYGTDSWYACEVALL